MTLRKFLERYMTEHACMFFLRELFVERRFNMGYRLIGILGDGETSNFISRTYENAQVIGLHKNLYLIPFIDELFDEINQNDEYPGVDTFTFLSPKVSGYLKNVSMHGKVAYIEADYSGGSGGQGAVVWQHGNALLNRQFAYGEGSINEALLLFGVIKEGIKDEFETVGLNRYRFTEDWLDY
jgi:hypothetical protein